MDKSANGEARPGPRRSGHKIRAQPRPAQQQQRIIANHAKVPSTSLPASAAGKELKSCYSQFGNPLQFDQRGSRFSIAPAQPYLIAINLQPRRTSSHSNLSALTDEISQKLSCRNVGFRLQVLSHPQNLRGRIQKERAVRPAFYSQPQFQ